mgnify:CR=1 FL=1
MNSIFSIIKKTALLVFGVLAIVFGTAVFIWVAYNIFSGDMLPQFREKVGNNYFIAALYLVGGISFNLTMISFGKKWIKDSGLLKLKTM